MGLLEITAVSPEDFGSEEMLEAIPSFLWSFFGEQKSCKGSLLVGSSTRIAHSPCLKWKLSQRSIPLPTLPPMDNQGEIQPESEQILQRHVRKFQNQAIPEVLVHWKGTEKEDATWEDFWPLSSKYPHLACRQGALKGEGL